MPVARVWPLYIAKLERKERNVEDLTTATLWLTGFTRAQLDKHLASGSSFAEFFAAATINPNAELITGVICGVRVENIEDPLMQKIRYLDKLVDELAKGRALEKVLRT
jgi:hypothetical protein